MATRTHDHSTRIRHSTLVERQAAKRRLTNSPGFSAMRITCVSSDLQRARVVGQPSYTYGREGMKRYFRASSVNRMFCRSFVKFTRELISFVEAMENLARFNFVLECTLFAFSVVFFLMRRSRVT